MKELIDVAFPGLGLDTFTLNKIVFSIGPIEVRWYGLIITLGIVLACWYTMFRGKRNEGVISDDVLDIAMVTVALGVLGARLYYVLTTLNKYEYKSLIDVIAIWNGGLAIYGGIIGGCLGIVITCLVKKVRWQKLFDMAAPGVMIAQALGRWGNFFNGEAHGYAIGETTRFYFFNTEYILPSGEGTLFHSLRMGLSHTVGGPLTYYHPTFLYESLWNVLGFVLINLFYKRKKFDGQIALMYFAWYGFGRMFIEGLRTDSLYLPGTTLRISQLVGLVCFVGALLLMIGLLIYQHYRPELSWIGAAKYAPVTAGVAEVTAEEAAEAGVTEEKTNMDVTDGESGCQGNDETDESEEEKHGNED
jgi:phosphatidylglycerol:prolipoprotein diacylglycerol transferase